MPELPEVETIRSDLEPLLVGRTIRDVRIHKPDIVLPPLGPTEFRARLAGASIAAVERRGKSLLLRLDRARVLQIQLRMTGRFAIGAQVRDRTEYRHVAAEFSLDDGATLLYDDVRRLGGFCLLEAAEWARKERALGPEPLGSSFSAACLRDRLAGSRAPVKNALLDQRRIAGLGNIYASEALFLAGVDPRRPAGELGPDEIRRLHRAIRRVLRGALAAAGTTFRDYRAVNGRSGRFQQFLHVYWREGLGCRRCGAVVVRIVQAGRSTFLCPACQA